MTGRRLCRFFERKQKDWNSKEPPLLAKHHFGDDLTETSVYLASDSVEETRLAAAFWANRQLTYVNDLWAVRISFEDIRGLVEASNEKGLLGVPELNRLHRNLEGSPERLVSTIARVQEAFDRGEARLRYIGKKQIIIQLERFLEDESLPEETHRDCNRALKRGPFGQS